MSNISDVAGRYGAIVLGLLIGTAAKYGVAISDGEPFRWRTFVADALMLGMLGLIAVIAGDLFALTNQNARVFVGALSALLSARLIRMVRDKALKRAEAELARFEGTGAALRQIYEPAAADAAPIARDLTDKRDRPE